MVPEGKGGQRSKEEEKNQGGEKKQKYGHKLEQRGRGWGAKEHRKQYEWKGREGFAVSDMVVN